MERGRKLKKVVIREELVLLTNDTIEAVILQQLLYWTERTKDFLPFIKEEQERLRIETETGDGLPLCGWIYKKAEELAKEALLALSSQTIHRRLQSLVQKEYIYVRKNEQNRWDKTNQYRVNLAKIILDLQRTGISIPEYELLKQRSGQHRCSATEANRLQPSSWQTETGTLAASPNFSDNHGEMAETESDISSLQLELSSTQSGHLNNPNQYADDQLNSLSNQSSTENGHDVSNTQFETPSVQPGKVIPEITGQKDCLLVSNKSDPGKKRQKRDAGQNGRPEGKIIHTPRNKALMIEQKFIEKSGRGHQLSPKDLQAIHEVADSSIPLEDALRWLDEAFERYKPKFPGDGIRSFAYCKTYLLYQHYYHQARKKAGKAYEGKEKKHERYSGHFAGDGKKKCGPSEETLRLEQLARERGLIHDGTVQDINVDF